MEVNKGSEELKALLDRMTTAQHRRSHLETSIAVLDSRLANRCEELTERRQKAQRLDENICESQQEIERCRERSGRLEADITREESSRTR